MAHTITLSHVRSLDTEEHEILKVLSAQNAKETTSDEVDADHAKYASIGAKSSGAVSGGTVLLEGCPISADAAQWITLATLTVNGANKWFGADAANGLAVCRFLRARISAQVANGTVDVYIGVKR
jgi:hypothetical protein